MGGTILVFGGLENHGKDYFRDSLFVDSLLRSQSKHDQKVYKTDFSCGEGKRDSSDWNENGHVGLQHYITR